MSFSINGSITLYKSIDGNQYQLDNGDLITITPKPNYGFSVKKSSLIYFTRDSEIEYNGLVLETNNPRIMSSNLLGLNSIYIGKGTETSSPEILKLDTLDNINFKNGTIQIWINKTDELNTPSASGYCIFSHSTDIENNKNLFILKKKKNDSFPLWELKTSNNNGTDSVITFIDSNTTDTACLFTITWNSLYLKLYYNNTLIGLIRDPNLPERYADHFYIGSLLGESLFIDTYIHDLLISDTSKSYIEISNNFTQNILPLYNFEYNPSNTTKIKVSSTSISLEKSLDIGIEKYDTTYNGSTLINIDESTDKTIVATKSLSTDNILFPELQGNGISTIFNDDGNITFKILNSSEDLYILKYYVGLIVDGIEYNIEEIGNSNLQFLNFGLSGLIIAPIEEWTKIDHHKFLLRKNIYGGDEIEEDPVNPNPGEEDDPTIDRYLTLLGPDLIFANKSSVYIAESENINDAVWSLNVLPLSFASGIPKWLYTYGIDSSGIIRWEVDSNTIIDNNNLSLTNPSYIDYNGTVSIECTVQCREGIISFYYSTFTDKPDYLYFYIDGIDVSPSTNAIINNDNTGWGGTTSWTKFEANISEGEHTFIWKYTRRNENTDKNKVWISKLSFPVNPALTLENIEQNIKSISPSKYTNSLELSVRSVSYPNIKATKKIFVVDDDSYLLIDDIDNKNSGFINTEINLINYEVDRIIIDNILVNSIDNKNSGFINTEINLINYEVDRIIIDNILVNSIDNKNSGFINTEINLINYEVDKILEDNILINSDDIDNKNSAFITENIAISSYEVDKIFGTDLLYINEQKNSAFINTEINLINYEVDKIFGTDLLYINEQKNSGFINTEINLINYEVDQIIIP